MDRERQSKFYVEALRDHHHRAAFCCGTEQLDRYMQKQAMQDLKKHAAVPFVLTEDGENIAGYYTLSQFAVELDSVPEDIAKRLPRYPMVSTTLLGRLAISQSYRGLGLGEMLLMDALRRSLQMSRHIASAAVVVDAIDEAAVSFYRKYSFLELPRIERRLFLPMKTIQRIFG